MSLAEDLLAVLDDPTHMWSHALKELSKESQRLFLTLPLLPQPISVDDLQVAYSAQEANQAEPFLDSLRALEDSFISIDAGSSQGRRWVNFRNPSLQDFSYEYLNKYSDWLGRLLGRPVYYEQIISVYNLAMSRLPGHRTLSPRPEAKVVYHEGAVKFTGIRSWVVSLHGDLITKAVNLALSRSEVRDRYTHINRHAGVKLKELVEIILVFGEPSGQSTRQSLGKLVNKALKPANESSATAIYDLLRVHKTAELIERYSTSNAMDVLRTNILDKDTWKFSILSRIDEDLGVDSEASMSAWGNDYLAYVDGLVEELSDSTDYEDLDNAIRELTGISSLLGVDLYDSISTLEEQRDHLPPERDNGDYERYSSGAGAASSSRELDNVFASLLE